MMKLILYMRNVKSRDTVRPCDDIQHHIKIIFLSRVQNEKKNLIFMKTTRKLKSSDCLREKLVALIYAPPHLITYEA